MKRPMKKRVTGEVLLEVLMSMLIIAFGVLGYVGLQSQSALLQLEAYQRSQALLLLNDIAQRMYANRTAAASYVGIDIGTSPAINCSQQTTLAGRDICEWTLLIQGAAETSGTTKLGAMVGARACISQPSTNQYVLELVWQGIRASGAPLNVCGKNAYADEKVRRSVTTVVRIGTLT